MTCPVFSEHFWKKGRCRNCWGLESEHKSAKGGRDTSGSSNSKPWEVEAQQKEAIITKSASMIIMPKDRAGTKVTGGAKQRRKERRTRQAAAARSTQQGRGSPGKFNSRLPSSSSTEVSSSSSTSSLGSTASSTSPSTPAPATPTAEHDEQAEDEPENAVPVEVDIEQVSNMARAARYAAAKAEAEAELAGITAAKLSEEAERACRLVLSAELKHKEAKAASPEEANKTAQELEDAEIEAQVAANKAARAIRAEVKAVRKAAAAAETAHLVATVAIAAMEAELSESESEADHDDDHSGTMSPDAISPQVRGRGITTALADLQAEEEEVPSPLSLLKMNSGSNWNGAPDSHFGDYYGTDSDSDSEADPGSPRGFRRHSSNNFRSELPLLNKAMTVEEEEDDSDQEEQASKEQERLDKERTEQARIDAENRENEKREQEERQEKERMEQERLAKEKQEKERIEREKQEQERIERERQEKERIEREKQEKERLENERLEKERLEKERLEKERLEKERLEKERLEKERLEKERLEKERLEEERLEKERLEKEKQEREEKERLEKERLERLEKEAQEKDRLEKERLQKERLEWERQMKERIEKERLEREAQEKERLEKERLEKERLEKERLEKERLEKERLEKERLEKERLEKERLEKERLEKERLEKERLEKERLEKERLEKERLEKERLEKERLEKERLEKERLEKDRLEKERLEKERQEKEVQDRIEKERQAADALSKSPSSARDKSGLCPHGQVWAVCMLCAKQSGKREPPSKPKRPQVSSPIRPNAKSAAPDSPEPPAVPAIPNNSYATPPSGSDASAAPEIPVIPPAIPGQNSSPATSGESLDEIQQDSTLWQLFRDFCTKELCIENLDFLEAADKYAKLSGPEERQTTAQAISAQFLHFDAPTLINLDSRTRKTTLQAMDKGEYGADLFNKCKEKIENLVHKDSLRRFKKTEAFRRCKAGNPVGEANDLAVLSLREDQLAAHSPSAPLSPATPEPAAPPPERSERETQALEWAGFTADKKKRKRQQAEKIVQEVLSTEQTYVASLNALLGCFVQPLKIMATQNNFGIDQGHQEQIQALISNLELLGRFHNTFLTDLEKEPSTPAKTLLAYGDFFKFYKHYLNNYEKTLTTLEALRGQKKFVQFLDETKRRLERHGQLDLMSYLIMPVQRVPRYVMLLKELRNSTEPAVDEWVNIDQALSKLGEVASDINEAKREMEARTALLNIQNRITNLQQGGLGTLVAPHRRLVREQTLQCSDHARSGKKKRRVFLLFNDLLLWTSNANKYKGHVRLASAKLEEFPERNKDLRVHSQGAYLDLHFDSAPARMEWQAMIIPLINEAKQVLGRAENVKRLRAMTMDPGAAHKDQKVMAKLDDIQGAVAGEEEADDSGGRRMSAQVRQEINKQRESLQAMTEKLKSKQKARSKAATSNAATPKARRNRKSVIYIKQTPEGKAKSGPGRVASALMQSLIPES
eukprot:g73573.t1